MKNLSIGFEEAESSETRCGYCGPDSDNRYRSASRWADSSRTGGFPARQNGTHNPQGCGHHQTGWQMPGGNQCRT